MDSVLAFHSVTDAVWFESLITALKRKFSFGSPQDLIRYYAGLRFEKPLSVITVDDGERTFYEVMWPVLRKHGVPATVFVSPHACSQRKNFWFQEIRAFTPELLRTAAARVLRVSPAVLTPFRVESIFKALPASRMAEVIDECRRAGRRPTRDCENMSVSELREICGTRLVTLGAHTMNHPILTNEEDRSCIFEITESVQQLAALLDRPVTTFAYPNGIYGLDFDERERDRSSGVWRAPGIHNARGAALAASDNPLRIPRIAISNGEPLHRIGFKIAAGSLWGRVKKLAHTGEEVERLHLSRVLGRQHRVAA